MKISLIKWSRSSFSKSVFTTSAAILIMRMVSVRESASFTGHCPHHCFITVGHSPDCDKASGGMRTDLHRKTAKAAANPAPIPPGAELN